MRDIILEVGKTYKDNSICTREFTVLCLGETKCFVRWNDGSEGAWLYRNLGYMNPNKEPKVDRISQLEVSLEVSDKGEIEK